MRELLSFFYPFYYYSSLYLHFSFPISHCGALLLYTVTLQLLPLICVSIFSFFSIGSVNHDPWHPSAWCLVGPIRKDACECSFTYFSFLFFFSQSPLVSIFPTLFHLLSREVFLLFAGPLPPTHTGLRSLRGSQYFLGVYRENLPLDLVVTTSCPCRSSPLASHVSSLPRESSLNAP